MEGKRDGMVKERRRKEGVKKGKDDNKEEWTL